MLNRSEGDEQGKGISPGAELTVLKTILPPPSPKWKLEDLGGGWSGDRDAEGPETTSHREFLLGGTRRDPILEKSLDWKRFPIEWVSCFLHTLCE